MITPSTRFKRDENLLSRDVAGEAVLVPLRRQSSDLTSIFTLNEVGAAIWELIARARSVSEIARAVSERFEVSGDQALADVIRFAAELQTRGFIAEAPGD
jgi:hypothetical protein